jgi:arylsulfatase
VVPTRKSSQYFEMNGHRAIWADGWKAVSFHQEGNHIDDDIWELYHLDEDFSECNDLAAAEPDRLRQLVDLFWAEAGRYGVLPIQPRMASLFGGHRTAGTPRDRDTYVYYPPLPRIPADAAPQFGSRSWELTAEIERPSADSSGVLIAAGTVNNGLSLYVDDDGHLVYDHNAFMTHTVIRSDRPLPTGAITVSMRQDRIKRGPARIQLHVTEADRTTAVGVGIVPMVPVMISSIGFDIGANPTGVTDAYDAPFPFAGRIARVEIATSPALSPDEEAALELAAATRTQ